MSSPILVAYSTVYGSTQEAAQFIAEDFRKNGSEVDFLPARDVKAVDAYRAVILGAPLYMFRWHKDAHRFLDRHRKTLESLPPAIFALGPFHNKEDELESVRSMLAKELARHPWLKPAASQVFVGRFDPTQLRFPHSLIFPIKNMPPSDERDWNAISAWCESLRQIPAFARD